MFKVLLLAGASVAAFTTSAADAATFTFTGSSVQYVIPTTGLYDLKAIGAAGGGKGGLGGLAAGQFNFVAGSVLDIFVGGRGAGGNSRAGGGGGGTFVFQGTLAELVAGGGGGAGAYTSGHDAATFAAGSGRGGAGGNASFTSGGGGAGVYDSGSDGGKGSGGGGGSSPNAGAAGGGGVFQNPGGFGGGGGGGYTGGGGGGGFTGGNGGGNYIGGGGGTSFVSAAALNASMRLAPSMGDGRFDIDLIAPATAAVPEPATWAMMILGLGGVGAAMRRDRARRRSKLNPAG